MLLFGAKPLQRKRMQEDDIFKRIPVKLQMGKNIYVGFMYEFKEQSPHYSPDPTSQKSETGLTLRSRSHAGYSVFPLVSQPSSA